jgi:hypothetical protein
MKTGSGSTRCFIAAAAHGDGAFGSLWRADATLLNRSGAPATAELRFRGDTSATSMVVVADDEQVVIEDVVAELGADGSGSLEVFSDRPLMAGSRTYNIGADGTFGQYLDGVPVGLLADDGATVWLPQLLQNTSFRSNIGLLNTASVRASVRIRLFDGDGVELAEAVRSLAPHQRRQLQEPFRNIAGRTDLDDAYATVTVESGEGVLAYASVVDNATNDPTTVPMLF